MPVVGRVCNFASDLCFLDDIQLEPFMRMGSKVLWFLDKVIIQKQFRQRKMNNYCKKCRLRDGCLRKCKEAEVYEQGYCDGVSDCYKGAVDALTPDEQQPKLIIKIEGLKTKMENKYKLWVARDWVGMLFAYFNKPIRDTVWKEWDSDKVSLRIDDSFFPELKWEDEPLELELRPLVTDLDTKAKEYADNVTDNEEIKELIINAFKAGYNS